MAKDIHEKAYMQILYPKTKNYESYKIKIKIRNFTKNESYEYIPTLNIFKIIY